MLEETNTSTLDIEHLWSFSIENNYKILRSEDYSPISDVCRRY